MERQKSPISSLPSLLGVSIIPPSSRITNSSLKLNTTTPNLLSLLTKMPPIPPTYSPSLLPSTQHHHPQPPPLLPTSVALIAASPSTSSFVAASIMPAIKTAITSKPHNNKNTTKSSRNRNGSKSSNSNPRSISITTSNETKLDIQPNFLIKQPVPNISSSYFRSSSLNSHPVKHNDSDTDFFVSDKTKNYSKLIYQDINIESLDDDFGDHHNHVDKDSDNNSDSDDSASRDADDDDDDANDKFSIQLKNNMYFGTSNYTIVSTQIGSPVDIPCTVHNIGESVVSLFFFFFCFFHVYLFVLFVVLPIFLMSF